MADVALQQCGCERRILRKIATGIDDGWFETNAEARRVDFLRGKQGAIEHRPRDQFVRTRRGEQIADLKILQRHELDPTQPARLIRLRRTVPSQTFAIWV